MTPKQLRLAADMYQRRDDMRRLLGARYQEQVSVAQAVLTGVATERQLPLINAALELAKEMTQAGAPPDLIICALVEECEKETAS